MFTDLIQTPIMQWGVEFIDRHAPLAAIFSGAALIILIVTLAASCMDRKPEEDGEDEGRDL